MAEYKISDITNKIVVLCALDDPTPIAYMNLYEEGDIWIKIRGCEGCPNTDKCCGNCPLKVEKGCVFHIEAREYSRKPFNCIVHPKPTIHQSFCQLEFRCIKGSKKDKVRKVCNPGGTFDDS